MFEIFIDIGHYNRDKNAYLQLVKKINNASVSGEKNMLSLGTEAPAIS